MTFGLMPLGAVPAGVAAEAYGVRGVVVVGGLLSVVAVLILFSTLSAFRTLDRELEDVRERAEAGGGVRTAGRPGMSGVEAG